jgi:AraC family transcriptional regulator of adaptative response/methylated-DNA-[protein]-cysteine methyltransferase
MKTDLMGISYEIFAGQLGICLVATTDRGVCNVLFADTEAEVVRDLVSRWPKADFFKKKGSKKVHDMSDMRKILQNIDVKKLDLHGTEFQIRVWKQLMRIPAGKTTTYGDIASTLGDRKLARAVGSAIGANPIGMIIPCHRVLAADGGIGGFRWGIGRKKMLLEEERVLM